MHIKALNEQGAPSPGAEGLICAVILGTSLMPGNVQMSHIRRDGRASLSKSCQEGIQGAELKEPYSAGCTATCPACAECNRSKFSACTQPPTFSCVCHAGERHLKWPQGAGLKCHRWLCIYAHVYLSLCMCESLCVFM